MSDENISLIRYNLHSVHLDVGYDMMNKVIDILLVEDNPDDEKFIESILSDSTREHLHINCVTNLKEAIRCVKKHDYHIILLELSLPDSEGLDTLMQIDAESPDTPIIVLTGNENTQLGIEAVQIGAQDYLPKADITGQMLTRSIRYAVERHRIEMAVRRSEQEYRALIDDVFDTSMVAVLILDRDFHVVWCNEATEVYFGIERERLLGRDKRKLIDDDLKCLFADPDDYASRLLKAYKDNSFTERFECQVIPEGERIERWLEHWSQPIRDGIYVGGRIEQYNDITDRKRYEIAERKERQFAEALHDINTSLTSTLKTDEVFQHILLSLERVVPHDYATIMLLENGRYRVLKQQETDKLNTRKVHSLSQLQMNYEPYIETMLETSKPIIIDDLQTKNGDAPSKSFADLKAYIGCPIFLHHNVIGFINLFGEKADFFSDKHAERLKAFSRLAAIAIQNARLFAQSKKLAAHEERQRLARDLHDSVSQTLFTCRAMSETALKRWESDPDKAYELIRDVNQLTMTALSEMRILLLELRPSSLNQINLKQLFEQYLQPIQLRRDFEMILLIDEVPPLPSEIQLALYRITQEALNNIDKHAQATKVEIKVIASPEQIQLLISDNGDGFDINEVSSTHLGLRIMQERAEEIGASIKINAEPNIGTQIKVVWNRDKPL